MKKTFEMTDLECAHCAARMEAAIGKLEHVTSVSISFLAQKATIEAEDDHFDEVVAQAQRICRQIEPDCRLVARELP